MPPGVAGTALITLQSLSNPADFVTIPVSLAMGNVFDRTGSVDTDADLDNNGVADANDLGVLAADLGRTNCATLPCAGDLDGNGDVDGRDLGVLLSVGIGTLGPSGLAP